MAIQKNLRRRVKTGVIRLRRPIPNEREEAERLFMLNLLSDFSPAEIKQRAYDGPEQTVEVCLD